MRRFRGEGIVTKSGSGIRLVPSPSRRVPPRINTLRIPREEADCQQSTIYGPVALETQMFDHS